MAEREISIEGFDGQGGMDITLTLPDLVEQLSLRDKSELWLILNQDAELSPQPREPRGLTSDHAGTAKQLLAGVTRYDSSSLGDRTHDLVAAEAHAMLAIADELAKINETLRSAR